MWCLFHVLAWAPLLFLAKADRMTIEMHDHHLDPLDGEPTAVTVCEDDTIWEQIMASPDVSSIRAIPWKDITDSMANYLSDEALLISNLEGEVEKLREAIESKKNADVSAIFTDEQIQTLIAGSISTENSFGSIENAKNSKCGKPGNQPRVPFESSIKAKEKIVSLAQPLLSSGEFKSEKSKFLAVCKDVLGAEGFDDLENYCGEVCWELAEVVQGLSDQSSLFKGDTAKLEKVLAAKNLLLLDAQKKRKQCEQSMLNIQGFKEYLESLDAEIMARHEAVRSAERELDSAQWALDDLEKNLAKAKEKLSDAIALLQGNQESVTTAREALAALQKEEEDLIDQVGAAKRNLAGLREELANMKSAANAVLEIKKYVSTTTLKMGYFVDMAVRKPVRDIGLVESTDVWDYFSKDVSAETCSTRFEEKLSEFHQYCTGPAMEAFEKIKRFSDLDLTPLCSLGEESKIAAEGNEAVQTRIGFLTRDMEETQSWLDPFKGTGMKEQKEATKKVEEGEPEGLRQVTGVYWETQFYTGYLKEWKAGRGKFLELLEKLQTSIETLEADVLKEDNFLKRLKEALDQTASNREAAQANLDVALADEEAALGGKQEVEEVIASLDAEISKAKLHLSDLEEAVRKAIERYMEARALLISEHAAKKSGTLALSQLLGSGK